MWGKHLLPRAAPGPQLQRTATLSPHAPRGSQSVPGFVLSLLALWHGLSLTHLRLLSLPGGRPQPSHLLLSVPITSATYPGLCFPFEGQNQRLNLGEITSPPRPKEKREKNFKKVLEDCKASTLASRWRNLSSRLCPCLLRVRVKLTEKDAQSRALAAEICIPEPQRQASAAQAGASPHSPHKQPLPSSVYLKIFFLFKNK